jgi:hypothetical protein
MGLISKPGVADVSHCGSVFKNLHDEHLKSTSQGDYPSHMAIRQKLRLKPNLDAEPDFGTLL